MRLEPSELLPHRYPFLLLDEIEVLEVGRRARGRKQVSGSEWPIVGTREAGGPVAIPHMLLLEAMAQLSAAVIAGTQPSDAPLIGYFMGCDRVRMRGEALPGDTVDMVVELIQFRRGVCKTRGVACAGSTELIRATLTTIVRPAG